MIPTDPEVFTEEERGSGMTELDYIVYGVLTSFTIILFVVLYRIA